MFATVWFLKRPVPGSAAVLQSEPAFELHSSGTGIFQFDKTIDLVSCSYFSFIWSQSGEPQPLRQVDCRYNSWWCGKTGCFGGNSLRERNRQETEEQLREWRSDDWSSLQKKKHKKKKTTMAERPAAGGGDVNLQDVLRGRTGGGQRMKSSSNMIRVFISSTFTGQSSLIHRWCSPNNHMMTKSRITTIKK